MHRRERTRTWRYRGGKEEEEKQRKKKLEHGVTAKDKDRAEILVGSKPLPVGPL